MSPLAIHIRDSMNDANVSALQDAIKVVNLERHPTHEDLTAFACQLLGYLVSQSDEPVEEMRFAVCELIGLSEYFSGRGDA